MISLRIEGATHVMKAPEGMNDCVDLNVKLIEENYYVSRWEPTPDELETLNGGGSVELWCVGGQPPVALMARPHA